MKSPDIKIRRARLEDAEVIATAVAMAIGDEKALYDYCGEDYLAILTEIASTEGTQYSYTNAFIAMVNAEVAGVVLGYDGACLEPLRAGTFDIIHRRIGRTPTIPNETEAGEFYLDSIAVLPQYRGQGVGRALLNAIAEDAFVQGHERVGLIVDFGNPQAEKLYTAVGFSRVGTRLLFGHQMWHLQKHCPSKSDNR